jgi:dihydrofolate reductase
METIIIAAVAKNFVIGKNNQLPWHYKEDFQHFKQLTTGYPVIMGRKTFESIGKPLPNRVNIILSRDKEAAANLPNISGCVVLSSLNESKIYCREKLNAEKMFIIGGSSIYEQAMPSADVMELTLVNKEADGDAFFPKWNNNDWIETKREDFPEFSFVRFERRR